ncbi:TfoX/Sxy family protein [Halomicroarcula sp. F13]|uniref:TfoX/Sxy family protein n=1 Tax=Haloarcula rubra TaxID=2487747 RepID=A0AAW4PLL7_9EURY|nr:TfoX/Sxy family protein [Halomicroarcula rubra]MBX0321962.1 TfoX/Sxy family protein [Halomicroarcula rubra]
MTYYDPETGAALKAALDDLVSEWPAVTERTMFGCPSYQADGTLFAVVVTDGVALTRLPETDRPELEAAFETGPFRAGERTVTKWVQVTVDEDGVERLAPFVESSYEAALEETD